MDYNTNFSFENTSYEEVDMTSPESNFDDTEYDESLEFERYCAELSGKDVNGIPFATVAYQCYAMEDDDNSPSKVVQFKLTTPWVQMWVDKLHPGYIGLDIAFRSFDDTELRLLWGRMNRHLKNMSKEPEKTWVLHFRILDNASLSMNSEEVKIANIINPSIFFLTRETPTMEAENHNSDFGLQGGNIIRMLIPEDLVDFEITPNEDYNLNTIRAEVQRDVENANYINATYGSDSSWNEDSTNF